MTVADVIRRIASPRVEGFGRVGFRVPGVRVYACRRVKLRGLGRSLRFRGWCSPQPQQQQRDGSEEKRAAVD